MDIQFKKSKRGPKPGSTNDSSHTNNDWAMRCKSFFEEEAMTHVEAMEALRKLTLSCNKLGVPEEATVHLDCFKRALIKAQASKKKKSTTIHDFFSKKAKTN